MSLHVCKCTLVCVQVLAHKENIYGRRYKKHDVDCFMFGDQVWRTCHGILFGNAWVLDCLNMFLMKNKEIKLRINVLV